MIVHNGEPFIKYNLENLYPVAHEILIVEGAVEKFRHASTPDGHSLDRTIDIIRRFPDPEGKIKLIQRDGFWPEKTEMSNAYMEVCTGDYIWQVDVDEFYKKEDVARVIKVLSDNPEVSRVDIKTINFWRGFRAVMQGASYVFGADEFIRIFRYRPGYRYLTHRPPTVMDGSGKEVMHEQVIRAKELFEKHGVCIYHYSYVFPEGVKNKSDYYAQMGWGHGCEEGRKWADNYWEKFINPLRTHIIKFPPSWIIPFEGNHPKVINKMIRDIDFKEDGDVERFLKSEWKRYADVGQRVTDYYLKAKQKKTGRLKAALSIIATLLPPTDSMAIRADKTIIEVFKKIIYEDV